MIASSENSGGAVVGAFVCGTECNRFKYRFILQLPFLLSIFLVLIGSL